MRLASTLFAALWLVAAGCGDDSATGGNGGSAGAGGAAGTGGAGGTGGTGGASGTGGSGGSIDAPVDAPMSVDDGGVNTTMVTPNSVPCQPAGTTCDTQTQTCCAALGDGGISVMCTATAQCPNSALVSLACDGPEDCATGESCCGNRMGTLGFRSSCAAAGMCQGGRPLCHNHTQCPTALSSCCTIGIGAGNARFTGECFAPGMEPMNAACDTP
jgi:hypothetical protein